MTLHHLVSPCSFGHLLAAFTPAGLCALLLGDSPEELVADLHRRFPKASHRDASPSELGRLAPIIAFIESPRASPSGFPVPLDIRGTAFQQRVWKALQTIPAGATTTYTALARSIGAPQSARAVAAACAANPLAVVIPCHRVIRADGALAGYRWGLPRKQALLSREQP